MKVLSRTMWRKLPLAIVAAGALISCGGETTDPKPVSLEDLKVAKGLQIVDNGNGAVRLMWAGNNNESDFSGYNVYGAKRSEIGTSLVEGETLKLLDDEGEPVEAAKDVLKKMNYNGTDLESPGTEEVAAGSDGEKAKIAYYPIYKDKEILCNSY